MPGKLTIPQALERMREWNRQHPDPCPEAEFEETLQGLARPLMEQGLVDDVSIETEACRLSKQVAEKLIEEGLGQARLYLRDEGVLVGSKVRVPNTSEPVVYLGLVMTEHGVAAVVRVIGDVLLEVHYSRLTRA